MELKQAQDLAVSLMAVHGLNQLGWRFTWDNAKTHYGVTKYRSQVIALSRPLTLLNAEDQVKNTILHEIAHVLAGAANGHNWNWQAMARQVGANPERCGTGLIAPSKYAAKCVSCLKEIKHFYRKPTSSIYANSYHSVCGKDKGRLEIVTKAA